VIGDNPVAEAQTDARACLLSRTGFSGERGYEMFVDPHLACDVWDNILHYGKNMG
jgi:aminomethyltransferase